MHLKTRAVRLQAKLLQDLNISISDQQQVQLSVLRFYKLFYYICIALQWLIPFAAILEGKRVSATKDVL